MRTQRIESTKTRTVATTYRGDIRTIASLAMFWQDQGEPTRTLSELLRLTVESLFDLVTRKWPDYEVLTHSEAYKILTKLNLITDEKGHNMASLADVLSVEDLLAEGGIDYKSSRKIKHDFDSTKAESMLAEKLKGGKDGSQD